VKEVKLLILVVALALVGCGDAFGGPIFRSDPGFNLEAGYGGAAEIDAGASGGAQNESDAASSSGGAQTTDDAGTVDDAGGARNSGGASSGGRGSGGTSSSGGRTASGGSPEIDAGPRCAKGPLQAHSTGTGATWSDCVPIGTHNNSQAQQACATWCASGDVRCIGGCFAAVICGSDAVVGEKTGVMLAWYFDGTVQQVAKSQTSCSVIGTWD
jgi:hypothetical protein